MTNQLDQFVDKKKAEAPFISLADGESVHVLRLNEIKPMSKPGYAGEEKDILRFKCIVETSEGQKEKNFDNGTQRFAQEMQEKGVTIGSSFTITRSGVSTKTRYNVSNVTNPSAVAPVAPTVPVAAPVEVAPVAAPVSTTAPVAP